MARSPNSLGAVGIGVSDLARSVDFYSRVLGLTQTHTFKLDHMDEVVLAYEGRSAVVLMHWTDGSARNYKDVPVKLVFYVTDPPAIADRIRADGLEVTRYPTALESLGGSMVGLAKDPDGYVIELLQAPASRMAASAERA
jgi:lactoylglutathione lyase